MGFRVTFCQRWIAACTAGEFIGIGVAVAMAVAIDALVGEPRSVGDRVFILAMFALVGVVEGSALAVFQWRVLRTRLPRLRAGEWTSVTVAVAVVGWLVGMMPSLFIPHGGNAATEPGVGVVLVMAALAGAGAGLCFGAAQWFVLRRHAEQAERWVWIHVPAWALAMGAIFLGASLPTEGWPGWLVVLSGAAGGVAGGMSLGAVTGVVAKDVRPWVDERSWSLSGKICAVTGANSGIGREVAIGFARLGARVVLLCRRPSEGERVQRSIVAADPRADVSVVACDLTDFGSVRGAAASMLDALPRLDVLVHSAGATFTRRTMTSAGVESTLAVDVVGPYLLTALLRRRLEVCGGRVITLTGASHRGAHFDMSDLHFERRPYEWRAANAQAQRGRWLFTWELARREPKLVVAAVHPGAVLTAAQVGLPWFARTLVRTLARPGFVRAEVGAIPVIRLSAQPDPVLSGRYFDRCRMASDAADPAMASRFWAACEEMTGEYWSSGTRERHERTVNH